MGKVTRKRYGSDFKAKVALDAIRGEQTLAELSIKHGIHQTMIAAWKRQAIERLWRSLNYKCVYLHAFDTGLTLHAGLSRWIAHYNTRRPHSALDGRTPEEAYFASGSTPSPGRAPATASNLKLAA